MDTGSFGGIGVFAIHEMGRFYRHVLVQKRYPHHGAVAFGHYGKALFEVFKFLGVEDISYNPAQEPALPHREPLELTHEKSLPIEMRKKCHGASKDASKTHKRIPDQIFPLSLGPTHKRVGPFCESKIVEHGQAV